MKNNKKKKKQKQPIPKKGFEFNGWAVFNWGISYDKVFRTRKQAQEYCWQLGGKSVKQSDGTYREPTCWDDVKDHFHVAKVKCKVV